MPQHSGSYPESCCYHSEVVYLISSPQASKYCADAKDYLEMMCHDLTSELSQFDLQKEKEFKQVLLDYAAAQLEKHEKVGGSLVSSSVQGNCHV